MKAAQYERPHSLRVVTKDVRKPREDEVLVRVEACGVCGTDVHIMEGTSRSSPPVVLGHEYAGRVEETGKGILGFRPGQKVAIDPNIACGRCFYCRRGLVHLCSNLRALGVDIDGGMAEYCVVPVGQMYELPEEMSAELCAFIEPVSCAVHGIDRAGIRPGDTVAILGGGTIGLIMLQLARSAGASRTFVVEPLGHKRAIAEHLGADAVLNPAETDIRSALFDVTGEGADVVLECAGRADTMELAVNLARRGGVVEFFGVCPECQKQGAHRSSATAPAVPETHP